MPRISAENMEIRENFLRTLFKEFENKRQNGEQPLSVPRANAEVQKKFGSKMRPDRVFEIRKEVFEDLGVSEEEMKPRRGRPPGLKKKEGAVAKGATEPAAPRGRPPKAKPVHHEEAPIAHAERPGDSSDPLFEHVLVPLEGEAQGEFLKQTFDLLRHNGLANLVVDSHTKRYAVISRS